MQEEEFKMQATDTGCQNLTTADVYMSVNCYTDGGKSGTGIRSRIGIAKTEENALSLYFISEEISSIYCHVT